MSSRRSQGYLDAAHGPYSLCLDLPELFWIDAEDYAKVLSPPLLSEVPYHGERDAHTFGLVFHAITTDLRDSNNLFPDGWPKSRG